MQAGMDKIATKSVAIDYTHIVPKILRNTFAKHDVIVTHPTNNNIQNVLRNNQKFPMKGNQVCKKIDAVILNVSISDSRAELSWNL